MKLHNRTDDRAVSELLGGIFIFALLLAVLVLAQVTLVPTLNQQVEYEHSIRAQGDLQDLQGSISRATNTGGTETVPVEMGVRYPNRFLLLNPPSPTGSIQASDPLTDGIVLEHVSVTNAPETDEFWNNPSVAGTYDTRIVHYSADYNEYRRPGRTVIEGSVMFRRTEGGTDVISSRSALVNGQQINLVALASDLSISQTNDLSVDVTAISGPSETVSVTNEADGSPISISIRTLLSEDKWRDRLEPEDHVAEIRYEDPDNDPETPNVLTVTLEEGVTYSLQMSKVGIGAGGQESPAYLTQAPGESSSVPLDGGEISVDVRDAFNNPVGDTEVTYELDVITGGSATISSGDQSVGAEGGTITVDSDADGSARVRVDGNAESVRVVATTDTNADGVIDLWEEVVFRVRIGPEDRDTTPDDPDEINPNDPESLVYLDAVLNCQGNTCNSADVSFENRGTQKTIDEIRVNFYQANRQGSSQTDYPNEMFVDAFATETFEVRGGYVDVDDVSLAPDDPLEWEVSFEDFDGDVYNMQNGNTLAVTILFADGSRSTYFIIPRQ